IWLYFLLSITTLLLFFQISLSIKYRNWCTVCSLKYVNMIKVCLFSSISVVEWSRADLGDEYVLLYRDELFDPEKQHPSFKNRVDLQDRQMKDGDVSLILNNVMINDNGTYECQVFMRGANMRKRANLVNEPISIIYLSVVPPGDLSAVLLVVAAVVGFLIFRKHKQQQNQDSYQPPAELQPL
uniref:Ig-like domain-containing protein n=1 Tax=Haplochromis burtoni TaxID=8153 RepID=A0A3Q2W136_HAPBU